MKKSSFLFFVAAVFLFAASTTAKTEAKIGQGPIRSIHVNSANPDNPMVYLGKVHDKKFNEDVEGYAIVHYAKNISNVFKLIPKVTCYSYLSSGARWKTVEPWIFDPSNTGGLDSSFILQNMSLDISKWEDATDGIIGNNKGMDILGSGTFGAASSTLGKTLDYKNEVEFAKINNPGAIAVTYIWGIFSGITSKRQLVEWDQVYSTDFPWSGTGEAGKMDFENIATHELGHSVGMGDLYNSGCNQETMYGYADYGQTNKRDLNAGDITGIDLLYN
jgi:hypothetical protein